MTPRASLFARSVFLLALLLTALPASAQEPVRAGIIGLDTSHSPAFTRILNDPEAEPDVAGYRVVAAYPFGSRTIASSRDRIPRYTAEVEALGVEVVDSIEELLRRVDVVLLETNDGRPHLEQALAVFRAGKPVFVDKPVAGSLADAVALYRAAEHYGVPVFSSSSLRYTPAVQAVRAGAIGTVVGADAYSPATLEPTHPELFWYGIHGVEMLFTAMGTGCETVVRVRTDSADVVVGQWPDGRIGTFRGLRSGARGYGGLAFGTDGIAELGPYEGYRPLVAAIVDFFRTGVAPVEPAETLEIYAFMEAAHESTRRGGDAVALADVLAKAEAAAEMRLRALGVH